MASFIRRLSGNHLHTLVLGSKRNGPYQSFSERSYYEVFTEMKRLKGLRSLTVECCPDTRSLEEVIGLDALRKLELIAPHKMISHEIFKNLFQMTQLTSLSLFRATHMVHEDIASGLANLVNLVELDLQWTEISTKSLKLVLPYLESLEHLNVSECTYSLGEDAGIESYPKRLKSLYLRNNAKLSEASLKAIKTLKQLETLDLTGVENVTNDVLKKISKLRDLKTLTLPRCGRWNANGVSHLVPLENLSHLTIPSTNVMPYISNSTLETIGKIASLKHLSLSSVGITDDGLKQDRKSVV